jgi:uncharacterized protein
MLLERTTPKTITIRGAHVEKELNAQEQEILLSIARQAIVDQVQTGRYEVEPREEKSLNSRSGCFVSIKQQGKLRGCIGNFQSELPLFVEVAEMAVSSATNDPRFYPMHKADLVDFQLEISVLSPLEKIEEMDEIEVGKHGIYLEKSFHRGVLLPQVAAEHRWDRKTFLMQTCIKAGLPTDAWKTEDAEIYIFSAQVFSEA